MNPTLVSGFLRQRLASPLRVTLAALATLLPLGIVYGSPQAGLAALGDSAGFAFILGAGLIGQDLSSGVLQLLFARPIRRSEYVLNRWLAAGGAASAVALARIGIAVVILAARGYPASVQSIATVAGNDVLIAFGTCSVLTLFSSLVGGLGDLALLFVTMLSSQTLQGIGMFTHTNALVRTGVELHGFVNPRVDLAQCVSLASFPWFMVTSYASTVTLCLALAIVTINHREISYASAG